MLDEEDHHISEKWQHLAIHVGEEILKMVNLPEYMGTEKETGYILMFFNVKNHDGKATLVAHGIDQIGLKKILKTILRNMHKARILEPNTREN